MNIVEKPKLYGEPNLFALDWRAKLAEWAATFATSESLRLVRYFIAGVGVSVGYTITVVAFIELLHWRSAVTANTVTAAQRRLRLPELRRPLRKPAGKRTVRPRARGLHRRHRAQDRQVRGGRTRAR